MNANVLFAVFKRNFTSYFASPLGYVFIFVFVCCSTFAAFWSPNFFANNLANLDQLNRVFPYIMLIFVPAITMAIWSEERRQGTDELILTLPASDLDIVLGKYLAAVGIFTVSLLYSLACNSIVLALLGNPDPGLIFGTYVGYWLVGLAMLGIGMAASFLTSNLTVAFILGAIFNAPLIMLEWLDVLPMVGALSRRAGVQQWGIPEQFRDFGRGVITFSGVVYFMMIVALALYVSMILIGRRHWFTGQQRHALVGHYLARAAALLVLTIAANAVFHRHDLRADVTAERLSTLSPVTRDLLAGINPETPVRIEAFISPTVPETYVQTRMTLLNTLRELEARGGGKLRVQINETERYTEEAARAQQRYGIEPRRVMYSDRGTFSEDHIFLHVAIGSGVQRVPPVFFDRGIPVEYELVRSIGTVADTKRKKIGVLNTDAQLFGRFDFQSMGSSSDWPVIEELRKQYDVVQIDPAKPLEEQEKIDALLAVQPSSLGPDEMNAFIAMVQSGVPTAIFEDPLPVFAPNVTATSAPKSPPGGMNPMMMMGGQQNMPKGDIQRLWDLLGVEFAADQIVWQDYNPYPKASQFPREFVFVDPGAEGFFNPDSPISSNLQQVLFPFPGAVRGKNTSAMKFSPLVKTGTLTGTVKFGDVMQMSPMGPRGGLNPQRRFVPDPRPFTMAARITGTPTADRQPAGANADESAKPAPKPVANKPVNVVLVTDLDMLTQDFFRLREQGDIPEAGIHFNFDNVTFVLNSIDELAGEDRFIELRKRRPTHRTLATIDKWTEKARDEANKSRDRFVEEFNEFEQKQKEAVDKKLDEMRQRKDLDPLRAMIELQMMQQELNRRMDVELEQRRQDRDRETNRIETDLNLTVRGVQNSVKTWAILLPPAPLVVLAVVIWLIRRGRESEGVSRSRMRA
jgi:ABC-2 type transport system permease protein